MEFDLHVSKGDYVTLESIPYKVFVITKKTFMVLFDNTIDHVDYVVEEG